MIIKTKKKLQVRAQNDFFKTKKKSDLQLNAWDITGTASL